MAFGRSVFLGQTIRVFPVRFLGVILLIFCIYFFTFIPSKVTESDELNHIHRKRDELLEESKLLMTLIDFDEDENVKNGTGGNDIASHVELAVIWAMAGKPSEEFRKVLSSLLKNMNRRIEELEMKIGRLENELHKTSHLKIEHKIENLQHDNSISECSIPSFEGYSACQLKVDWMKAKWNSDTCYAEWGVDGSQCSILRYLSEVEHWCPHLSQQTLQTSINDDTYEKISVQDNLNGLYEKLGNEIYFKWIRQRIERMENKWIEAGRQLSNKKYIANWRKKKILLHPGLLSDETGWNIAKNAFNGGPLGELVQWSDLISSLYILGHDITVTISTNDLKNKFKDFLDSAKSINCPIRNKLFDIIFIDIGGLRMLKKVAGPKFHLLHAELRVVDSFGSEPEFNFPSYADHKKKSSDWGRWDLYPKQFYTMFPHTPDNTFLGFVIEVVGDSNTINEKQNIAVVYGKRDVFWEGKGMYIDAIHEMLPLHGTVQQDDKLQHVPPYVVNHGVLPGEELHALLRTAKIFVGMGFPYEGPAPLEAIANGAVFLNPIFKKDSSMLTNANNFFKKKPTSRRLTSQHPYAETYIGEPHVRMIDMDDVEAVKQVVNDILSKTQVEGYMPYEFTCYGMIERLGFLVEKHNFSSGQNQWPPKSAMKVLVSDTEATCVETCANNGLICEPRFFPDINQRSTFDELEIECDKFEEPQAAYEEIDYPSYKDKTCYIQGNSKLFSCTGRYTDTRHICPCRDYIKGQVALCKDCLES